MDLTEKTLFGSFFLLSTTFAFAVDTANLRVIGSIAPAACTPTFAGGGTIDYGHILTASLSPTAVTTLASKSINYTIGCDAPVVIATSWSDARTSSAMANGNIPIQLAFGLGKQGVASIGSYSISPDNTATADGDLVDLIGRDNNGAWGHVTSTPIHASNQSYNRVHAYAPAGTLVPGAFKNFAGTISVFPYIAPTSTLDLTNSIALDGLASMVIRYL